MRCYQSSLLLARGFQFRCFQLRSSQCNVDVALLPNCMHVGHSLGLRQYSNGFVGLNKMPSSFDNIRPNDGVENSNTIEDSHQLRNSIERSGADCKQSVEHFQQRSNPQNHNPVNGGSNAQYNSQDYVQKAAQQNPGYLGSRNATGTQQVNSYWTSHSGPCQQYSSNPFMVNAVAHHPSGYQQEHTGVQSNLNAYHPTDKMVDSSGYYNTPLGPQQQHSNVSQNANLHHKQLFTASTDGNSCENDKIKDEAIEGTLQELDVACKEWDLVRAVECMTYLGMRGVGIDLPRYLVLIEACGEAKASVEAQAVHDHLNFFSPVSTSLFDKILDMYGKCGLMSDAYDTFNSMPERSLSTWVNMISWYAKNGLGEEAIDMFTKFKEAGLKPDGEMFFGLFDACGVVGDVTEGMLHFDSMSKIYGIAPTMDHYASIVRMFGSAGHLDGALEFVEKMPMEPNIDVWESLMNVSRIQGNIELGDRCAQIVELLDPSRLTNESKTGLLPVKNSGTLKKKVRKVSLSEHGQHQYKAGDRSHPEQAKIYSLLRGFKESMKEAGYVPETRFVLHDINQEEKEDAIMAHSERLACAYNLLTSSPRASMRIIKNLRVCGDCHNVFKIISKLVGREVIMRDQKRFHHFRDGKCSCNDYW